MTSAEGAKRPPIRVVLADANVLYSRVLRDYLLYATTAELIEIRWSPAILAEVIEHLTENLPGFLVRLMSRRLLRYVVLGRRILPTSWRRFLVADLVPHQTLDDSVDPVASHPQSRAPSGSAASSSASQTRALPSLGARQSPRGDSDPAGDTLGPLGIAVRLNCANAK